jgi:trehalose utilization protein
VVLQVTVWNENIHETEEEEIASIYPDGIHGAIGEGLRLLLGESIQVHFATLNQPSQGLPDELLERTDVLLWWSHIAQEEVSDDLVARVHDRVLRGMGFIALHSATKSKILRRLLGTSCCVRWRHGHDRELVWTVKPNHPIAQNLPEVFGIPQQEMFGEFFDIPEPDELIFLSTFSGGEVLRSGLCYQRGYGRVFYFSPGDQSYPVYHDRNIRQVLANAVQWAAPQSGVREHAYVSRQSPEGWVETEVAKADIQ